MTSERESQLAALEAEVIRRLAFESPQAVAGMLTTLAASCPPPFARWFTDQRWRILSLALDRAARGEIAADPMAWTEHLAQVHQEDALAMIAGKPVRQPKPVNDERDSALARVGGLSGFTLNPDAGILASWETLCHRLSNAGQFRHVLDAMREVAQGMKSASLDEGPAAIIGTGLDRIAAAMGGPTSRGCIGDALVVELGEAKRQAAARNTGSLPAASWGLADLDDLVPLKPGGLYVLAASPGGGKTSLALQSTLATAEHGRPGAVAIVSEEMPAGQLAVLMAARSLNLSARAILAGDPRISAQEWASLDALAEGWQKRGTVSVLDAGTSARSTTGRAVAWIRQRHQVAGGNLALVIVDHLGLLESDDTRATEYQRVSDTTRALKRAAVQMGVPILALCQMNRQGRREIRGRDGKISANPEPTLADLRGSGSIEQDADAVVMLHRPEIEADAKRVPVVAYVRKNRAGPLGSVHLVFRPAFQVFEVVPRVAAERSPGEIDARGDRMRALPNESEGRAFGGGSS